MKTNILTKFDEDWVKKQEDHDGPDIAHLCQ